MSSKSIPIKNEKSPKAATLKSSGLKHQDEELYDVKKQAHDLNLKDLQEQYTNFNKGGLNKIDES